MIEDIQLSDLILGELDRLLANILTDSSVRSVILFGSSARGTRHNRSDIDLLVLVDNKDTDQITMDSKIRQEAFGKIPFPLDLIIESIQDYEDRVILPTLERKIARDGKVLHAA